MLRGLAEVQKHTVFFVFPFFLSIFYNMCGISFHRWKYFLMKHEDKKEERREATVSYCLEKTDD